MQPHTVSRHQSVHALNRLIKTTLPFHPRRQQHISIIFSQHRQHFFSIPLNNLLFLFNLIYLPLHLIRLRIHLLQLTIQLSNRTLIMSYRLLNLIMLFEKLLVWSVQGFVFVLFTLKLFFDRSYLLKIGLDLGLKGWTFGFLLFQQVSHFENLSLHLEDIVLMRNVELLELFSRLGF